MGKFLSDKEDFNDDLWIGPLEKKINESLMNAKIVIDENVSENNARNMASA